MSKMMGKGKHMGRWYIDRREGNRSARARERRTWRAQDAAEATIGLLDTQEDPGDAPARESPAQGPGGGRS